MLLRHVIINNINFKNKLTLMELFITNTDHQLCKVLQQSLIQRLSKDIFGERKHYFRHLHVIQDHLKDTQQGTEVTQRQ
jgi:hypothetical protein